MNIDEVINNQLDLIIPIKKLKTIAIIKGTEEKKFNKKKKEKVNNNE